MGIEHSLIGSLDIKPGVSVDQLREALKPLSDANGWERLEPISIEQTRILRASKPVLLIRDTDGSLSIEFDDRGEVGYEHYDIVESVINALSPLVYPAPITFINNTTGDPDGRETLIWAGEGEDLALAQRDYAIEEASSLLSDGGFTKTQIASLKEIMSQMPLEKAPLLSRPRG